MQTGKCICGDNYGSSNTSNAPGKCIPSLLVIGVNAFACVYNQARVAIVRILLDSRQIAEARSIPSPSFGKQCEGVSGLLFGAVVSVDKSR